MRKQARARRSLKVTLLAWMTPALLVGTLGGLWLSGGLLREQANAAYDRALVGALRAIELSITTQSGGLALEQPYRLLEFFELTAGGSVYYRIVTEDGLAQVGNVDLPIPQSLQMANVPFLYEDFYLGQRVRVAAMRRELDPPLYQDATHVVIQVAEDMSARDAFTHSVLLRWLGRDLLMMLAIGAVLVAGVFMALRPLGRLRTEVEHRAPDDLSPVREAEIPSEVLPLVTAVNRHMARYASQAAAQRQFLDDASHQLRTPLTVLRTQVAYALRESDPVESRRALQAMREGLERAVRTTNQMLALARAQDAAVEARGAAIDRVELGGLVDGVARALWPLARDKRLDYGVDKPDGPIFLVGSELLLREALTNMLDNAIRYTPPGGMVTLLLRTAPGEIRLGVEDSGPGMVPQDVERAGVRFRRGVEGKGKPGAGLGLAIVRTVAEAHRAQMVLETRAGGVGLHAALVFTLVLPENSAVQHKKGAS
jgi:two-component system sensor histidine kinase TctE